MRLLFISHEFRNWQSARHCSYAAHLGFEDGFRANQLSWVSIVTPWLRRAREICQGKSFDQVWVEVIHTQLDQSWLEWIASLAPVRVALVHESLEYTPEECTILPVLASRRHELQRVISYFTHVLAADEVDAQRIQNGRKIPAIWWPASVPSVFVTQQEYRPAGVGAIFCGALYGDRHSWLRDADLRQILSHVQSAEQKTLQPFLFDSLHLAASCYLRTQMPVGRFIYPLYLQSLCYLRRKCFRLWLKSLQSGRVVVNLPSFYKGYPGRVVEAMAAGRPVISWEVPDRPRTKAIFQDGEEIFLFPVNRPDYLRDRIQSILNDEGLAKRVMLKARLKLRQFHTSEKRVSQILKWIETGEEPLYE